jgi:cysteine desulfurase
MKPIYLDYNATTPVDPGVLDAMLPFLRGEFGNPSSAYELGRHARDAIETARAEVASLIGALPDEILFTSGGTESTNLAILGAVRRRPEKLPIVTGAIEHPATDAVCSLLEQRGHEIRRIAPQVNGCVDADEMANAIDDDTALVTLIHAQNEIGTLQPLERVAAAARKHGAITHADIAQSAGKVPIDVRTMGIDLLSITGHKLYAPKGVGALYVRRGIELRPLLVGAGQERGKRPGTENVAGIVALGAACRIAGEKLASEMTRQQELRNDLLIRLRHEVPDIQLVGDPATRLPNTLNVLFPGISGRQFLASCPRIFASTGSACHADREEASAILRALGIPEDKALGAVRLSLGRYTTQDEVAAAAASLGSAWRIAAGSRRMAVTA